MNLYFVQKKWKIYCFFDKTKTLFGNDKKKQRDNERTHCWNTDNVMVQLKSFGIDEPLSEKWNNIIFSEEKSEANLEFRQSCSQCETHSTRNMIQKEDFAVATTRPKEMLKTCRWLWQPARPM